MRIGENMATKKYDILCIGLGPAGMAVSAMGASMGLKVCAIEKYKIGGECMNAGCIPSKALLKRAKIANYQTKLAKYQLKEQIGSIIPDGMFSHIQDVISQINTNKNKKMLSDVDVIYGSAKFVNADTVEVDDLKIKAAKIYICTGTTPAIPPILGLDNIEYLTNNNIFKLTDIPKSMIIIGGGAIGCEMAEAFTRLGCKVTIAHTGKYLLPKADVAASKIIESEFIKQGVKIFNNCFINEVTQAENIIVTTTTGHKIEGEKLLIAIGRKFDYSALKLNLANVSVRDNGSILVNNYLKTTNKKIFAVGDCNGYALFSHAAMHQGMIAIMNSLLPFRFKRKYKNYVVPWTIFTEPQISAVGMSEQELLEKGSKFETITVNYADYGAAIIENNELGFVKVFVNSWGRVYGAVIVGENSGEMINEWALVIQNKQYLYKILLLQHSFPTMGFLTKRVAETWMMKKMQSKRLQKVLKFCFNLQNKTNV